jgi:type IV pilus assembly protein PilY1
MNIKNLIFASLVLQLSTVHAEDIDLFMGLPADGTEKPNVLFIIDNTANWSRTGTDGRPKVASELEALASVFRGLPVDRVNVGLMLFTETGSGNSGNDGGYVRAAIRTMGTANAELYAQAIESLDDGVDKGNGGKSGIAMAEAYHYFAGLAPLAGNGKAKTDYDGNTLTYSIGRGRDAVTVDEWQTIYALEGNALDGKFGSPYSSPVGEGCVKNYIIYISNGPNQDNRSDSRRAADALVALGGSSAVNEISLSPNGSQDNMMDEWARWMHNEAPEEITIFALDIDPETTGQAPGWTELLKSVAAQSDGKYYDVAGDTSSITDALNDALSSILAVNSVFASVALPASTNAQSTFLNQVYIGLFRPDGGAHPRWYGNLKQYKLGFDNSTGSDVLRVLDANSTPIVDPGTGFIRECARSFWTPGTVDTYWSFLGSDALGECTAVANSAASNSPDGPVVEKGGHAYKARALVNHSARQVYTCAKNHAACTVLTNFNSGNSDISNDALGLSGVFGALLRDDVIAYGRGRDNADEDGDSNFDEIRPSVHGDVVHSQPVAIDYGGPSSPAVVVYYGANDGTLRAINGNRDTAHNGIAAGAEFWSFMPPEFFGEIGRLWLNNPLVKFPATGPTAGAVGSTKGYGMDGTISAFTGDIGGTAKKYLYTTMRRGGRSLYAFDVTVPTSPALLWKKGCPNIDNDTDCTSGFEGIGQTWSRANVTTLQGNANPLLIMGGGYDACEDYDDGLDENHACTSSNKGDAIYVMDAVTGNLLRTFTEDATGDDLPRAFPGNVTIVPVSDNDLDISFAYAADTGGNLYRIHGGTTESPLAINATPPDQWVLTKIAALGCGTTATDTCNAPRKFLFGPDVIREPTNESLTVLVGSGDREKPLYDYGGGGSVENYFYSIIDQPTNGSWWNDTSPATCSADVACPAKLTTVTTSGTVAPGDYGWKYALRARENVVSGALVVAGVVNFSTHIPVLPDAQSCESNLGEGSTYNLDFENAKGDINTLIAGGLAPTPVAGNVILEDNTIVPFCIGCGGEGSSIGATEVSASTTWEQPTSRVSWEIEE